MVEKFNDHYQDRFLDKVQMATEPELISQSLNFELRHNSSYRYSKLGGKTPLKALQASEAKLRFRTQNTRQSIGSKSRQQDATTWSVLSAGAHQQAQCLR